jgi:hypothetical protein
MLQWHIDAQHSHMGDLQKLKLQHCYRYEHDNLPMLLLSSTCNFSLNTTLINTRIQLLSWYLLIIYIAKAILENIMPIKEVIYIKRWFWKKQHNIWPRWKYNNVITSFSRTPARVDGRRGLGASGWNSCAPTPAVTREGKGEHMHGPVHLHHPRRVLRDAGQNSA